MYPNVTPPPTNITDKEAYLDQIAAPPPRPGFFSGKTLIILGAAVAILVVAIIIGIAGSGGKVKNTGSEILAQHIINLQNLIRYGESNSIGSSDTRKVMAETNLVLLSRINDLSKFYNTEETSFTNPSPEIADQYSDAQLTTELDQAKSNANLSSAYTKAFSNQLAETEKLVDSLYQDSKDQDLRATLEKTYKNLDELRNRLPSDNTL